MTAPSPSPKETVVEQWSTRAAPPVWATVLIWLQSIVGELDFTIVRIPTGPVVFAVCIAPIAAVAARSPRLLSVLWTRPLRAASVWLLWGVCSIAWSVTPAISARSMLGIIGLWTTAVWFTTEFGFARLSRIYTSAMAVFLTAGFVRDLTIVLDAGTIHRFSGFGLHSNHVARIALVTLLLSTIQLIQGTPRRWLSWWSASIGLVALVATGTRTTLLALVICSLVVAFRTLGLGRTLLIGTALTASLFVAVAFIPDPGDFVTRDENAEDISSVNGRQTIWSVALENTIDSPVLGHGVSSGEFLFPQAGRMGALPIPDITHAHNMVLDLAMSTGLPGLALFAIAIASYLMARRPPGGRLTGVILLAIMLSGLTEAVLSWRTSIYLVLAALFAERARLPWTELARSGAPPTRRQDGPLR